MSLSTPTKTQLINAQNAYILANSDLTSIRAGGRINAISGAVASVLIDFYRDLQVGIYQSSIQGVFTVFGFTALPGNYAATNLSITVNAACTIPQGYTCSTVGSASNPAILFQSTQTVTASGAGTITVPIQAVNIGSNGNVTAGSITNIISSVQGVVSIVNSSAATGGQDPETLSAQLARFQQYLQYVIRATGAALAYAATQVQGVVLASAVGPAYLSGILQNGSTYTDLSTQLNAPKGTPFAPYSSTPQVNDAFYIGGNGYFTGVYIDVAVAGSGLNTTWQYYNGTTWTNLTVSSDLTNGGETSGTLSFSMPSDWAATDVNGTTDYFIRLLLNSTAITTMPQWYSAFSNDPPPGYAMVYITTNPNVQNVLQSTQTALEGVRAIGDTVIIQNATTLAQNLTLNITPTVAGATQNLQSLVQNAITQMFSTMQIGQSLALSTVIYTVISIGNGTLIASATIGNLTSNVSVAPSVLLVEGTTTVNVGSPL